MLWNHDCQWSHVNRLNHILWGIRIIIYFFRGFLRSTSRMLKIWNAFDDVFIWIDERLHGGTADLDLVFKLRGTFRSVGWHFLGLRFDLRHRIAVAKRFHGLGDGGNFGDWKFSDCLNVLLFRELRWLIWLPVVMHTLQEIDWLLQDAFLEALRRELGAAGELSVVYYDIFLEALWSSWLNLRRLDKTQKFLGRLLQLGYDGCFIFLDRI